MVVPAAPVRVPSQRPLAPSVASVTSVASDKGDNEMILGDFAQISWHFSYSRGNPQKTSARRSSDEEVVRPVTASNGVPFLQMRSVGSHARQEGRRKERKIHMYYLLFRWVYITKRTEKKTSFVLYGYLYHLTNCWTELTILLITRAEGILLGRVGNTSNCEVLKCNVNKKKWHGFLQTQFSRGKNVPVCWSLFPLLARLYL